MSEDSRTTKLPKKDWQTIQKSLKVVETHAPAVTISVAQRSWTDTVRPHLPEIPIQQQGGHFALGRLLGRGGMGAVYQARQIPLERDVAVKVAESQDRASENSLLLEARVMGIVEHPNVVPVHVIGVDESARPIIVMKRVEGVTWESKIAEGKESLDWHLDVFLAVCRAISFSHSRAILHRDIKPENVMIGAFGEVYMLDWGLAATTSDHLSFLPQARDINHLEGTPAFMPPEMAIGHGPSIGVASDVYLLGATLFRVLTGRSPHQGERVLDVLQSCWENEVEFPADLDADLEEVLRTAMARQPEDRYPDVESFRGEVANWREFRQSKALTREAFSQLKALKAAVDSGERAEVQRHYGAARFGLEHAQLVWPDNPEIGRGFRSLRSAMFEFAMATENAESARDWAAQLGEDLSEQDEARLSKLTERVQAQRRDAERLQRWKWEFDAEIGRVEKAILALVAGVVTAALGLVPEVFGDNLSGGLLRSWYLTAMGIFIPFLAIGTYYLHRKGALSNAVNQQILGSVWVLVMAVLSVRIAGWLGALSLSMTLSLELLFCAATFTVIAISQETRVAFATPIYVLGYFLILFLGDYASWIFSATHMIGLSLFAIVALFSKDIRVPSSRPTPQNQSGMNSPGTGNDS